MKRLTRTTAAALTAVLVLMLWTLPVQGARRYDAAAQTYREFSRLTQDVPADVSLIVKTDGALPDFRTVHPERSIRGPEDTYVVCFDSEAEALEALPALQTQPGVEYAEVNARVYAQAVTSSDAAADSSAYHSWGVEYIHADALNERLRRNGGTERVTVAVVDSGIYPSHPLFNGFSISGTSMIAQAYDMDGRGHGTAVSGIIAECMQGLPVDLLEVRILNDKGEGTTANAASGIRYAAENGADVMNLSFVSERHSQTLDDAVEYALECGCLPVISSGNYGKNMDVSPICPSHGMSGIVVSGCDKDGSIYAKTCFGSTVDLCAPAVGLECAQPGGGYSTINGTSFAAPHVTAAAAMLKLLVPDANVTLLEQMLKENLVDMGDVGFDIYYGLGVPDLRNVHTPVRTLTIDAGEGAFPEGAQIELQLNAGSPLTAPQQPVREGYTFMGYLPDLPQAMPSVDLCCTALWLPQEDAAGASVMERKEPTCDMGGYVIYSLAGESPRTTVLYTPPLGHIFGAWTVVRPATQYREGAEQCTCVRCGSVRQRSIDKLPQKPLTIEPASLRLQYRTSARLTASEDVEWTTRDSLVAEVSGTGVVSAVGRGRTTIAAIATGADKTAECTVEVYYTWWQWLIMILLGGWIWY